MKLTILIIFFIIQNCFNKKKIDKKTNLEQKYEKLNKKKS